MEAPNLATAQLHPNGVNVSHGDDSGLIVTFENEAVHMGAESEKAGRPVFKDVPHIRILFPGDKTRSICRPVKDEDKYRFPRQWAAFENQQSEAHDGWRLEEWPVLTKSQVLNLKGWNVHTVEQLAAVPDSALHNLGMGSRELREKAQAALAKAADGAATAQLAAENARLREDLEAMKAQIAELSAAKDSKKAKDA